MQAGRATRTAGECQQYVHAVGGERHEQQVEPAAEGYVSAVHTGRQCVNGWEASMAGERRESGGNTDRQGGMQAGRAKRGGVSAVWAGGGRDASR